MVKVGLIYQLPEHTCPNHGSSFFLYWWNSLYLGDLISSNVLIPWLSESIEKGLFNSSGDEIRWGGSNLFIFNKLGCDLFFAWQKNDSEAASLHQEHTLPIMGPERLQEVGSYLTLDKMEKMVRPFAMPAEDFPPPSTPAGFSGYFAKSAFLERLVNLWPFHKHANSNGK